MELIKEPNPAFDKKWFLKSLHKLDKPIRFKINGIGNIYKSKMNGKPNFFVEMEILTDFPDCEILQLNEVGDPILNEDGNKLTTFINAKDEIIGIPYPLVPSRDPNLYVVSNKTNLFKILNPALISKEMVKPGNQKGINNISFEEITEALKGFQFTGKSVLIEKTTYNPYYQLITVNEEV